MGQQAGETRTVGVRVLFGASVLDANDVERIEIELRTDGSDSIRAVKQLIASSAGGALTPDDLLLGFGPNDRKMGRQYKGDPTVDEAKLSLARFSVLAWLQRFPHWTLSARLLPAAPPPPGEAVQRAAALAEKKDPDAAVQEARAKGEIPRIDELPAPWGNKPYVAPPAEELVSLGYLPAQYPPASSPLVDGGAPAAAPTN